MYDLAVKPNSGDFFAKDTEGTVSWATQPTANATGIRVKAGKSFGWKTWMPKGMEAYDLPATSQSPSWKTEYIKGEDTGGNPTVEVKVTNVSANDNTSDQFTDRSARSFKIRATDGLRDNAAFTTKLVAPENYTSSSVEGTTRIRTATALDATVDKVNNIAKSAEISGTATPGATIKVGDQEVTADSTTGAWSMTVEGLEAGDNTVKVVQVVDGKDAGDKDLSVTIVDGGTVIPETTTGVTLPRDADTLVPVTVKTTEDRRNIDGTIEFTAPEGTTFANADTRAVEYKERDDNWKNSAYLNAHDGEISNEGKTLTYKVSGSGFSVKEGALIRLTAAVRTPAGAAEGEGELGYVFSGNSVQGDFSAKGSTSTTIDAPAERDLTATVGAIDNEAMTAVVSGVATKGSTVSIGDQSVEVTEDDGAWTLTVSGLKYGENPLHVVQTIEGREVGFVDVTAKVDGVNRDFAVTSPENNSEHKGEMVTFEGNGRAGETVTMEVTNFDSASVPPVTVGQDGHWKIQKYLGTGMYVMDITQTNSAGTPTGQVKDLTINQPAKEDPVNLPWEVTSPESGSEHRGEMVTWAGTGRGGETITFTPKDPEQASWSMTVPNNGRWSINRFAGTGAYDVDVVQTNAAGTETGATRGILLNQSVNLPFAVTSPENNSEHKGEMVTFEGTGNANDEITLKTTNFESGDPQPVRVDHTGHWKIQKYLGTGAYTIDITQKNVLTGAVTGEAKGLQFNQPAKEDPVNLPWEVTSPESGSEHRGEMVTWAGTGRGGETITFTPKDPEQASWSMTVPNNGRWSINRFAGTGAYDVDVVQTNAAGTETGATRGILLNQSVNLPFAVTSPENNSEHKGEMVTFEGTGNANDEITLKTTNFESGDPQPVRVDHTGHWKIQKYLGTGAYTIDITQKNVLTGAVTGEAKGLQFNQPAS
ncbi:hypothetical protein KK101_16295 [Curtobacterium flaccumfaciens pv. oortii]|uniref:hypothetical protein n=1 Tax=Curtobacterium flaccumfaciens TaxID=2035 RepID=UPI001BDE461C|nr:hypothetical protein [Curtobacterium flaccumfaciens]MBT1624256.1 hypothetical protein [Curtobacterium flaccumfaciens pv. oortii]